MVFCVCFVSCASDSSSVCQLNYSRDQSGRLYSLRLPVIYFWMLILLVWYVWNRNSLDKAIHNVNFVIKWICKSYSTLVFMEIVDGSLSMETVEEQLRELATNCIQESQEKPLTNLAWWSATIPWRNTAQQRLIHPRLYVIHRLLVWVEVDLLCLEWDWIVVLVGLRLNSWNGKVVNPVFPFHLTFQLFRESALLRNGFFSIC